MRIQSVLLICGSIFMIVSCAGKGAHQPARLPPAAKSGAGATSDGKATLSAPMTVAAGAAAFEALAARVSAAVDDDEVADLGKILRAQGLEVPPACAGRGLLGLLQPGDVAPKKGVLAKSARGLVVFFRDSDEPLCAAPRTTCAVTLVPEGVDRVRVRMEGLEALAPEGKLAGSGEGLTSDAWLLEVRMESITECGNDRPRDGEPPDEGDPGYGAVAELQNERSGTVVLLFHRGEFHELTRYLSLHSQRSGLTGFRNEGSHDVIEVGDERKPGAPGRFLLRVAEERRTIELQDQTGETSDKTVTHFECHWIDLDADALISLSDDDLAALRKLPDHPGNHCGSSYDDDDDEELDKNLGGAAEE